MKTADKVNPLGISEKAKEDIDKLIAFAEKNKFDIEKMRKRVAGDLPAPGDYPDYSVVIGNFKIVYTIEEHPNGWFKHISVSDALKKLPSVYHTAELIKFFGFEELMDGNLIIQPELEVCAVGILTRL